MHNTTRAVDSGSKAITKKTGVCTDGEPCHHDVDLADGLSVVTSANVATVGEEMGRIESSVQKLERLCRGDEGEDGRADSL